MGYDMYIRDREDLTLDESYFRLNIFGMSHACDLMDTAGMLCHPNHDSSVWDTLPPYEDDHPDSEGGPAYRAAADRVLAAHNGECPGIPAHKFRSNDGWIVAPSEIRAALAAERKYPLTDLPDWWREWIDYLQRAAVRGGFEVH